MGRKKLPGLVKREGVWHIDKRIGGQRVCRSTETGEMQEAERHLNRVMEETRQAQVYGVRSPRRFAQAAAKFVLDNQHKRSLHDDISQLKMLMPWIGETMIDRIHRGTLDPWLAQRQTENKAVGTINHGLKIVRRILNLAASEWVDEQGLTWLLAAPKIKLIPDTGKRRPYPLNWQEQTCFFGELPDHLRQMALFAVNTGCRDREVCRLRWEWEIDVPQLGKSVFIIPGSQVKNGDERLVVLNSIAAQVVHARRSTHATHVFSFRGKPIDRMLTSAWKRARERAELPTFRVHDLKHTFGRRLRAAGVSFEDRQDLLGHRSTRITTHYSAAELHVLFQAAEKVCGEENEPQIVVLRGAIQSGSRKTHARPVLELLTAARKPLKMLVSPDGFEPSTY